METMKVHYYLSEKNKHGPILKGYLDVKFL